MVTERELPAFRIRGQWRIRQTDLESWVQLRVDAFHKDLPNTDGRLDKADAAISVVGGVTTRETRLTEQHLSALTERLPQEELHRRFVEALGPSLVLGHGSLEAKPFEVDLAAPLPQRARVYMYNATRPPGGRPLGEHKIQLIVPGHGKGERGTFDHGDGRIVLLVGYAAEEDVYILWDAGLYLDFAWSRNVQVKGHTIIAATAGKLATQERRLRPSSGKTVLETVVAAKTRNLAEAIERRMDLTRQRLMSD